MTNKHGYSDNKEQIIKRLSRAEGQVRGVSRMVEENKYCIDVLTQINAAKAALDKAAIELLRDHAKHCLTDKNLTEEGTEKKADELVDAIGRMLSR